MSIASQTQPPANKPEMLKLNVLVPASMHRDLKIKAACENTTMRLMVLKLIEDFLAADQSTE